MNQMSVPKLAAALRLAQVEFLPIKSDRENPFFHSKYATLTACVMATRQALANHGLVVSQSTDVDAVGATVLVTALMHESGEQVNGRYPINPVKNDPQGIGSAITYARRYAYCAIIGAVPEGEDDDGNAGTQPDKRRARKQEAAGATNAPPASDPLKALRQEVYDKASELEQRIGQSVEAHVKAASQFPGKDGKPRFFVDPFDPSLTSEKWLKSTLSRLVKELEKTEPGPEGAGDFKASDADVDFLR